jgi:agmatine deiminase
MGKYYGDDTIEKIATAPSRSSQLSYRLLQGWKADYWYDDYIPTDAAYELYLEDTMELVSMVNEGGSIEVDGRGTLMAKKSSVLNRNRNPRMSQSEAEAIFSQYLGVSNFIWLDGTAGVEITDDHIDGTARFANGNVIVTHNQKDFWEPSEYDVLKEATDATGQRYQLVHLPLTQNKIIDEYYGIYINYYVANDVVIVPKFNDPNDAVAKDVLEGLYPQKTMALIDFRELYEDGGLVHCVTMQEPVRS